MSRIEPQKPHIPAEKPDAAYTDRERFEKLEKVLELKENVQQVLQGREFFKENFMVLPEMGMKNTTVTRESKMTGSAKKVTPKVCEKSEEILSSPSAKRKKSR